MTEDRPWFKGLQSLMAILFFLVFVSHAWAFLNPVPNYLGTIGVSTFFVLSGFLSVFSKELDDIQLKSLFKTSILFLWRKIKKFYPLYFIFLWVAIPFKPCGISDFIKCIFLTQSYFLDANVALSLNWPCWFLSSIMLCYLLTPATCFTLNKIKNNKIFLYLSAFVLYAFAFIIAYYWRNDSEAYSKGYYYTYIFPPTRFIDYSIGCIMGVLFKGCRGRKKADNNSLPNILDDYIETIGILLLMYFTIYNPNINVIYKYTLFYLPFGCFLVLIFARERGFITKAIQNNVFLLQCGKISFELYIIHRLAIEFYLQFSKSLFSCFYALLTTIILAQLFYNTKTYLKGLHNRKRINERA